MTEQTGKKPAKKTVKKPVKKTATKRTTATKQVETSKQEKKGKHGGARPGAGQPPFKPTDEEREQVKKFAAAGITQYQMALLVRHGIDENTLVKHFKREIEAGRAAAHFKVGGTLYNKAVNERDTTAMIWYTKTQMGWKETKVNEHTGKDGDTIQFQDIKAREFAKLRQIMFDEDEV